MVTACVCVCVCCVQHALICCVMRCVFPVTEDKRSMRMTSDLFVDCMEMQHAKRSSAKSSDRWWQIIILAI